MNAVKTEETAPIVSLIQALSVTEFVISGEKQHATFNILDHLPLVTLFYSNTVIILDKNPCNASHNTTECSWDGGDCLEGGRPIVCDAPLPKKLGDNTCDGAYNTPECSWDGGDCVHFNYMYPNCRLDNVYYLGNSCECISAYDFINHILCSSIGVSSTNFFYTLSI